MRYGKIIVYIFSVLLLAIVIIFGMEESEWDGVISLSAMITVDGHTEEVKSWEKSPGEYFILLPSYAKLSETTFQIHGGNSVWINDQQITKKTVLADFELNRPYVSIYKTAEESYNLTITFVQSGNLPTMYIDTASGSMDYIHEEKGNEEAALIRLYTSNGEIDYIGKIDSLNGRGNATWYPAKKAYSMELSSETNLLGMGSAEKWVLLANALDSSNLRNKMIFDFAKMMELTFSPDSEWVDLYLNGEYAGLYLLCERNEIHSERVDVPLTDSFLVSMEIESRLEEQKLPYVSTAAGIPLRIHSSSINTERVKQLWQSAENAVLAEDGVDPNTGEYWTELIDLDSWVKKYLVEEIFGNLDAGAVSQYFYYQELDGVGKIYAGPVWDYDLSMGSMFAWQIQEANTLSAGKPHIWACFDSPWYYSLTVKKEFQARLKELYPVFQAELEKLLNVGIEEYKNKISQASCMNQVRWSGENFTLEVEKIRTYMKERMEFLNDRWINDVQYHIVQVSAGGVFACYAIRPGGYLPDLLQYEPFTNVGYEDWYMVDTDMQFDITQPIYEDAIIYLKHRIVE